jgi:archaellum biogenesis protein FlaJ (TadC family)
MDTFREAKGKTGFQPYEKLLESMLACDVMPVYKAFEDVEADRAYYMDKHRQDNEELIQKKSLIAKTIAFLPLCLIIILKLIVPFVVQGLQGLQTAAMM